MKDFSYLLLLWFSKNKRNLPWRETKDPYKIWISEIILQQTQVTIGIQYYKKFLDKFPNIQGLANANEKDVLFIWKGLGYYSRARNMHKTAQYITSYKNSVFPISYTDLLKLKGIGKYTASAISSICFNQPIPTIDANVFRFFSRLFLIEKNINNPSSFQYFFEIGQKLIDSNNSGDFNQAILHPV